ncbi:MAG: ABC transporter ATP-binding protein [Desulfobacteraceae bacterium]|nr:ABC transporter ATP-binding protein [Desulfobacteraceae bacterium]
MNPILEVRNLVKRYPSITAVDGISFSIKSGTCFGLLGPNGAGKTTTIEIIEDIISPTSGEILYKGAPRTSDFLEEIGIQFQATSLFYFLTVRETLETYYNLYRNPMDIEKVIELCRLEDILDRDNSKISWGQKQRLLLAMALVNDPDLIFLDEPTTGLDPQTRRHVWDIVEKIKAAGKTTVLTTHYMEEAQILCDEIAIVDMGKIIAQGSLGDILNSHRSSAIISIPAENLPDNSEGNFEPPFVDKTGPCASWKFSETQKRFEFHTDNVNECLKALLELDLTNISVHSHNLEDLFLELTGHQPRK